MSRKLSDMGVEELRGADLSTRGPGGGPVVAPAAVPGS